MPDIDNFMECLDVDKANPIFLNYLWEYFGFIPYAYGVLTKGEPYTEKNLENWVKEDRVSYRGLPASSKIRHILVQDTRH